MPAVHKASLSVIALALFVLTGFTAFFPAVAHATTPTATTLNVTSSCLTQGCAVTLTAKVAAGSTAVNPGLVYFCEGSAAVCQNGNPVGKAQITAGGNATILHAFAPGTHSIYAVFHGTNTYAASTSSTRIVTIALSSAASTTTNLVAQPVGTAQSIHGEYNLQATVTNIGAAPPTGSVSFVDTTYSQFGVSPVVATSNLGPGTLGGVMYQQDYRFLEGMRVDGPSNPTYTAVGDVNNDGYNDIVFVSSTGFNVLASDQDGFLSNSSVSVMNNLPAAPFALVDLNSDGKLDAVFPDSANNAIRVVLGNGNRTFGPSVITTSLANSPVALYPGDFNNDGIPDLAILLQAPNASSPLAPFHSIQIALGNGDGTFTAKPTIYLSKKVTGEPILIGDEDGDGKLDLTVSDSGTFVNQFQVLHGNGDGTFTPLTAITQTFGEEFLVSGDFNADGIPDLVSFDGALLSYWQGVGDGTFAQVESGDLNIPLGGDQFTSLMVGDFNNDGVLDVAGVLLDFTYGSGGDTEFATFLGNNSDPSAFFLASGGNAPPLPDTQNGVQRFGALAVADFNADGIPDVIDFTPGVRLDNDLAYDGQVPASATTTSTAVTTLIPADSHMIVAQYSGDTTHTASTSSPQYLDGSEVVNEGNGFADSTGLTLNGGATIVGGAIQLTDGVSFEARSAFNAKRLPVYDFHSTFDFQIPNTNSDGLAFVIQSNGPNAVGSNGGGIGYGLPPGATSGASIVNSLALVFDTHNNQGEGANSVRIETGGITSPNGSVDLTPSGIDLHSGHRFQAELIHVETSGSLALTLTDLTTNKVFTHTFKVDLFGAIGDTIGYVGFTSATGATASTVNILNWSYSGQRCCDTIPNYGTPYFPEGFANAYRISPYHGAAIVGTVLQLTHGTQFENTSTLVGGTESQQWVTDFDFSIQGTGGDGFTFFRTTGGGGVFGGIGGALGYAGPYQAIVYEPPAVVNFADSLAIKFDLHDNDGESPSSTGLYFNGAYPSIPSIDLYPSRIDLHSGHTFHARIAYFHGAINVSITDLTRYAVFTTRFAPSIGLGDAAVGFTAATGATANTINILNMTCDEVDVDF